jgi:DNA-binding LacI/PurR family transcriptional regulator
MTGTEPGTESGTESGRASGRDPGRRETARQRRVVTIADVARKAGVSVSTVSYALSGKRSISRITRERVQRAVTELDYHPHAGAQALASSRSSVLALMVPLRSDMYLPVIMEIVTAIALAARRHGQDVLLLTGQEGPDGLRRVVASGRADALILMDVELHDRRIPVLREVDRPAVLVGLPADSEGLTCIDLDFGATGAACADHLASLGHTDVALIGESKQVYTRHTGFAERTLAGFRSRCEVLGVRTLDRPCEGSFASVAGTLARILEERPSTTGFVVQNEAAVPALLSLLRQQGRIVPDAASVVAICPDQVAVQSSPRLTSVSIPAQEMGRGAVDLVMAQLRGEATTGEYLLAPKLTIRESTAGLSARPNERPNESEASADARARRPGQP